MNCPYCGKEMEPGMITSINQIAWYKEGKRSRLTAYPPDQDKSIVLSEHSVVRGSAVVSYLCRECQKIVIDYADGNCDLNKK